MKKEDELNLAEQIIATAREPMLVLDVELRVRSANEPFYRHFRLEPGESVGRPVYELGNGQWDIAALRELLEQVPQGKLFTNFQLRHNFKSLGRRTLLLNARQLDRAPLILLAIEDVTGRRRAKEVERASQVQLQTLFDAAPLGIFLIDADFRIRQVNSTARPVFGDIPDLTGRDVGEVFHRLWPQEYAEKLVKLFRHTLNTGEPYFAPEWIEQRRDRGVIEHYEWQVNRIPLPEGRYGIVCYFRDISAQVATRQAIARSEDKYRTLIESMDEGFCILQLIFDEQQKPVDYRYIEINQVFEQQTGMKNALGRTIRELVPDIEPFWFDIYGNVALTGEPMRFVDHAKSMGRWFDVYACRIGEPHERRVAVLFNDITASKQAEQELRKSEARQSFLVRLGDALRPLTDPRAIKRAAAETLGQHLGVATAGYVEVQPDEDTIYAEGEYNDGRAPGRRGWQRMSDYGKLFRTVLCSGQELWVENLATDERNPRGRMEATKAIPTGAVAAIPLLKDGRLVAYFYMMHHEPRQWSEEERAIIPEVAERTWAAVERARAEEALRESQEHLQMALDAANMGTFIWYPREDRTEADERMLALFGLPVGGTLTLAIALATMIHPDDRTRYAAAVERATGPAGTGWLREDIRVVFPGGSERWLAITARAYFEDAAPRRAIRLAGMATDISERKKAEAQLKGWLQQKEILLKEINHRVKNNLQAITNLLYIQASTVSEEPVRQLLRAAQDRIKAIALIHEKLYQSDNLAHIDLAEYLTTVTRQLLNSYGTDPSSINLQLKVDEARLDVDTAVPLGVIVNELVSNALKHAFPPGRGRPEGQADELTIELQVNEKDQFLLSVSDNGVGLPPGLDLTQGPTLGLRLVEMLAGHMGGELNVERNSGTAFKIRFSSSGAIAR